MKTRLYLYPLASSLAIVSGFALVTSGCTRTDDVVPAALAVTMTLGAEIDDTVITTKVKLALIEHQETKAYDIKVQTHKGKVQLSGFVDNRAQADTAVELVLAVQGVQSVEDSMSVKDGTLTAGNRLDDSVITTMVMSALLADPQVKSLDISVVTRMGEVQLSGFVMTVGQIDHAVSVTKGVEGVKSVQNQIELKK